MTRTYVYGERARLRAQRRELALRNGKLLGANSRLRDENRRLRRIVERAAEHLPEPLRAATLKAARIGADGDSRKSISDSHTCGWGRGSGSHDPRPARGSLVAAAQAEQGA